MDFAQESAVSGDSLSLPVAVSAEAVSFYDQGSEVTEHHFTDEADQGEGK